MSHSETYSQGDDEKHLVVHQFYGSVEKSRKKVYAQDQPYDEIEYHQRQASGNLTARNIFTYRYSREDDHHKNPYYIFYHQSAEYKFRKLSYL